MIKGVNGKNLTSDICGPWYRNMWKYATCVSGDKSVIAIGQQDQGLRRKVWCREGESEGKLDVCQSLIAANLGDIGEL